MAQLQLLNLFYVMLDVQDVVYHTKAMAFSQTLLFRQEMALQGLIL